MRNRITSLLQGVAAAAVLCSALGAHAAVLVVESATRVSAAVATPVDLTAQGGVDWAYWAPTTGTAQTPPVAPTNEKVGGTAISAMGVVAGGTTLRGSTTATTVERYSWSDGTTTPSGTNASLAGLIFTSELGNSAAGKGVSFTLTGDTAIERTATLYLGGFGATGNLTLTLNGATTLTDTQVFTNANPKQIEVYTVRYRPDGPSDVLTVQWAASNITETSLGHVGAQAVTVAVPEPATLGVAAAAALGLLVRRRRP